MSQNKEKIENMQVPFWQPGMRLFLRLSGWIGGPVLVAVVIGRYLDAIYHTAPWLFLLSVGIAFAVSMWALIHYGLKEIQRIENEFPIKKSDTHTYEEQP